MSEKLQTLPIGIQSFEMLWKRGHLYVDKTARLMELVNSDRYFLSRPWRFGKSLTLSTLDAMFQGKTELFKGLAVEGWLAEQAKRPAPVLRLDMSMMDTRGVSEFETSLIRELTRRAEGAGVHIESVLPGGVFQDLITGLYDQGGSVVVLIDEYDKPILDAGLSSQAQQASSRSSSRAVLLSEIPGVPNVGASSSFNAASSADCCSRAAARVARPRYQSEVWRSFSMVSSLHVSCSSLDNHSLKCGQSLRIRGRPMCRMIRGAWALTPSPFLYSGKSSRMRLDGAVSGWLLILSHPPQCSTIRVNSDSSPGRLKTWAISRGPAKNRVSIS